MSKQLKTFFIFWGVWFIASLLNGLLSGICIIIFGRGMFAEGYGTIGLTLVCSFLFSVPLVAIVWLFASIAIASGKKEDALFQNILGTALLFAVIGAVLFIITFGRDFKESRYAVGLCIIISALTAVLTFRKSLKTDE